MWSREPVHITPGGDPEPHITLHASKHYWFRNSDRPKEPGFAGFLGSLHVYDNGIGLNPPLPTYTIRFKGAADATQLFQDLKSVATMQRCVLQHTQYQGTIAGADPTYTPAPLPERYKASGKTASGTKRKRNDKALGGGKLTWTAGQNPPFTNPGPITLTYMQNAGMFPNQYAVNRIVDSQLVAGTTKSGTPIQNVYYRVDWSGWPPDTNWYPAKDFQNCPAKLQEFHNINPNRPGPPANLNLWHQQYIRGDIDPGIAPPEQRATNSSAL